MFFARNDLLYTNPDRLCYGVAVTDIDGDGLFEFVVAGFGCANVALKWTGRGYLDCADAVFADPHGQAIGLAAGDVDADGIEELYILNSDTFAGSKQQIDRLFALHGGARVDLFAQPEAAAIANPSAGRSVAVIDRTGAG
ncbi:MAG: FG-GAP repeat domain-containing protein, partial [Roseiflexaceae bacterium]